MTYRCHILRAKIRLSNTKEVTHMDYEIVTLEKRTIVGLTARTANSDPEMNATIGKLWSRLFEEKIFFTIPNKTGETSVGLYSDYTDGMNGEYSITVGCEVTSAEHLQDGLVCKTIEPGRYAKFVIFSKDMMAVAKVWQETWQMPLERTNCSDFEEYFPAADGEAGEIHVYIGLR